MASSLREDLVCPICLALFQDPHMLSCGHNFCLACLQGCLPKGTPEAPCPECRLPFQPRSLVRNRALANVARKVRRLGHEGAGSLPGEVEGDFCEEHDEPLKLFCLQDRLPICVICRDQPRHRGHRFLPTKDAVRDAQGKLKPYQKLLKKNLASITTDESLQEKEITTLESSTEDILKDISKGFEVLHQTLHEKEQHFKKVVQEMRENNLKEMKAALASLKEDRALQAETLANIKAALDTTDHIAFLKDFKNLMDKVQKYPLEEEDEGESSNDEEEASDKNREHSDQEEARNDEEEGSGEEYVDGDEEYVDGDEEDVNEEEENEGEVILVDPALEEFKDNLDFEAWKEMLLKQIKVEKENEEEETDENVSDEEEHENEKKDRNLWKESHFETLKGLECRRKERGSGVNLPPHVQLPLGKAFPTGASKNTGNVPPLMENIRRW